MRTLKATGKQLGTDHELALALWRSGIYEARTVAAFIDDPAQVTTAQMDSWCADCDSWAIVDTVCFHLFDRAPDRWGRVEPWVMASELFTRRAGFALLWALALHDKQAPAGHFTAALELFHHDPDDDRHLVTKAQTMALRAIISKQPDAAPAALAVARDLADSPSPHRRRVGRPILKAFT